jgi:hypothetical protein
MQTNYTCYIVIAIAMASMLVLNPITSNSQPSNIQGTGNTTAMKPVSPTKPIITIGPQCGKQIFDPNCIPTCPVDCLSEQGIRLTIDTGDRNTRTIRGNETQIENNIASLINTSKLSNENKNVAKQQVADILDIIAAADDGESTAAKPKKPGVAITCQGGTTIPGGGSPGGTVTCGFTLSWPAG